MWDQKRSTERVRQQKQTLDKSTFAIKRLTREMDLNNLSMTEGRLVKGAHLYVDINNFATLVENATLSREDYKPLHRYLHVMRREQRHIAQAVFDGDKIQVQAQKFHGILYKPYDDDQKLTWRAVLMAVTMVEMIMKALPKVFSDYPIMSPAVGVSYGDALVANIGVRGDRELISVGSVANHAAKIIGKTGTVTVTSELWSALSETRQTLFAKNQNGTYTLDRDKLGSLNDALDAEGLSWTVEASVKRMNADLADLPLKDIESEEAKVLIDLYSLGPKKIKTCSGGSAFIDIDGYTSLVDSLLGDEKELAKAVKLLHLFRYELQRVAEADFEGISVQHQGDRMQAIIHLPYDDADKVRDKLVDMCVSFNSSVETVLNSKEFRFFDQEYHVSIGAAFGKTVVVRSGVKGDLDASCLGRQVLSAENLQLTSKGNEMRIAKDVFAAITNDTVREIFTFESESESYVAKNLTWQVVDDRKALKALAAGVAPAFNTSKKSVDFENGRTSYSEPLKNPRNWGTN